MAMAQVWREHLVIFGKDASRFIRRVHRREDKGPPVSTQKFNSCKKIRACLHKHWRRTLFDQTTTSAHWIFARNYTTLERGGRIFRDQNHGLQAPTSRHLATTTTAKTGTSTIVTSDNIIKSPIPDVEILDISFHDHMFRRCDLYKDLPALSEYLTGRSYSYAQVKEKAVRVASALHRLGYKKGQAVLSFSTNNIDISILMLACACLGIWYSAANPSFTPGELSRQIVDSGCVAVFTVPQLTDKVDESLRSIRTSHNVKRVFVFGDSPGFQPFQSLVDDDGRAFPDVDINPKEDVFVLPYSSGTTGLPKGVMLTHRNVLANCLQTRSSCDVDAGERTLGLLPLFHIYGMVVIQYCVMQSGGQVVMLPKFEPDIFLRCLQDKKIQLAHLVPMLVTFLAKHPGVANYDITSLRRILSGAAPLGEDLTREFLQRHTHGVQLCQGYGLTETSPVTNVDTTFMKIGSVGTLVANTFGKIVHTETKETLGPNEPGEYCIKGPQVMKGYYRNPVATKSMITQDGWLHTGDVAYFTEDGNVYIKDRVKELIKFKGFQVSPAELEALLLGRSDVNDAAVIGIPDSVSGELPKAFVVKKPGASISEADIVKFVEGKMTSIKWLRGGVQFVDSIPRSLSGKILRRVIKEMYVESQADKQSLGGS